MITPTTQERNPRGAEGPAPRGSDGLVAATGLVASMRRCGYEPERINAALVWCFSTLGLVDVFREVSRIEEARRAT